MSTLLISNIVDVYYTNFNKNFSTLLLEVYKSDKREVRRIHYYLGPKQSYYYDLYVTTVFNKNGI